MFLGTFNPKLDDKGRLFLPAKFRDQLLEGLVVTMGQTNCLTVWPAADFMEIANRVRSASVTVENNRDYSRFLGANASEDTPDKQGRITLTARQRAYAGLDKEVTVIGTVNRVELWNPERWVEFSHANDEKYANVNEEIFPGL